MLAFTMACTAASAASFTVPSWEYNSSAIAAPWRASARRCTTALYWAALQPGRPLSPASTLARARRGTDSRAVTHVGDPVSILIIVLDITHSQDCDKPAWTLPVVLNNLAVMFRKPALPPQTCNAADDTDSNNTVPNQMTGESNV